MSGTAAARLPERGQATNSVTDLTYHHRSAKAGDAMRPADEKWPARRVAGAGHAMAGAFLEAAKEPPCPGRGFSPPGPGVFSGAPPDAARDTAHPGLGGGH